MKPWRSPKYLAFIRTKPCLACGSTQNVQAAHQNLGSGSKSIKAPDCQAVPLCFECHQNEHNGRLTFWTTILNLSWIECVLPKHDLTMVVDGQLSKSMVKYLNEFLTDGAK